jgi:hypothetical protein
MKLPIVNNDYGNLYNMVFAPIRLKLLLAGIELRVFNHLSEPVSAEELAQVIHTHPGNTRVFLDGLAAIDLVQKNNGLYRNTALAQTFLVEGNQTYLGELFAFMASSDASLEHIPALVKLGPPPQPETSPFSEEIYAKTAAMMVNVERAGDAQQMVKIVTKLPEFSSFHRMLDLGGGPGLIGMSIVNAHSSMKGVIFDLPHVVKVAEACIKEYGMEDRLEVLGGDFNRNAIGKNYDLVVTCNSLQFSQAIDPVMKKIYGALNPGGVCISMFGFGKTNERTKPETLILGLLSRALVGQDLNIDRGDIADSMVNAGFKSVSSRIITTGWGLMELDIARK